MIIFTDQSSLAMQLDNNNDDRKIINKISTRNIASDRLNICSSKAISSHKVQNLNCGCELEKIFAMLPVAGAARSRLCRETLAAL